jgi:hypothetical protein
VSDAVGSPSDTLGKTDDAIGKQADEIGKLADSLSKRTDKLGSWADAVSRQADLLDSPCDFLRRQVKSNFSSLRDLVLLPTFRLMHTLLVFTRPLASALNALSPELISRMNTCLMLFDLIYG